MAPFSFIFVFSNQQCNFYNKIMWKNIQPVWSAGIRTRNLQDLNHQLVLTSKLLKLSKYHQGSIKVNISLICSDMFWPFQLFKPLQLIATYFFFSMS